MVWNSIDRSKTTMGGLPHSVSDNCLLECPKLFLSYICVWNLTGKNQDKTVSFSIVWDWTTNMFSTFPSEKDFGDWQKVVNVDWVKERHLQKLNYFACLPWAACCPPSKVFDFSNPTAHILAWPEESGRIQVKFTDGSILTTEDPVCFFRFHGAKEV